MANLIGRTFGNYQIVEQIGIGGMATVYKAYQANMDRYVAIKVLPEQLAKDPQFFGRFEQEARTIARLENKHILPVYDYGEEDGIYYLVMRYIGAGTLKDITEKGPVDLPVAVSFLTQIAEALQYAHERGVIHRDIKTSNVLIGEGNQCYLTDFGIAKLAASSSHFTSSGAIIGTPAYMSPEQCNGLPVDARSDLYSLGIVLYEMLTGRVPFEAETPIAVVRMQIDEPLPSPRSVSPNVPETVEQVVFRALAKDPEHRYGSVRDFADALNAALESFTQRETITSHRPPLAVPPDSDQTIPLSETRSSASTVPVRAAGQRRGWLIWLAAVVAMSVAIIVLATLLTGGDDTGDSPAAPDTTGDQAATSPDATASTSPAAWTTFTHTGGTDPGDVHLLAGERGIWMASNGGLVHWTYEGVPTKYTSADGLAFNNIQAIARDAAGDLWLAGGETGLGVMRLTTGPDGAITDMVHYDSSAVGLDSDYIWTLLPEPDGTMLVGAYESYLEAWDGSEWYAPDVAQPDDLAVVGDRVWDLTRTQDGTLWAAGPRGLVHLAAGSDQWEPVDLPGEIMALGPEAVEVVGLDEDPLDGALWVFLVTEPDYAFYTWQLVPPVEGDAAWTWHAAPEWWPEDPIYDMLRASDNMLWVVTYDQVLRVDPATNRQTVFTSDEGISGEPYLAVTEAPDGSIWLATDTALAHFTGQRWVPYRVGNEPPINNLTAMAEAGDGTLWFAGDWGSLITYHDETWDYVENLDADVRDLLVQGDAVWAATHQGLVRWLDNRAQWYGTGTGLAHDSIRALALDPVDPAVLWIGTDNGLNALNTAGESVSTWTMDDGLPGPAVSALYVDPAGVLWLGTAHDSESETGAGQIGVLRLEGDQLVPVGTSGDPFTADDQWLLSLAMDDQGQLWAGTDNHLYRYDGTRWQAYSGDDGAPEWSLIGDIQVDGDVIWFAAGYDGLYRLDSLGWLRLGAEGTGSSYVHRLHRAADGALWILTYDGITRLVGDPYAE